MNPIAHRLTKILEHYQMTAAEFADKLGIQKSSISHLLSGRNKPSFSFLEKMAHTFPEINLTWFITGDGDIFNRSNIKPEYSNLRQEKNDLNNSSLKQNAVPSTPTHKKLTNDLSTIASSPEQIIFIFGNDTFKILNKS